MSLLEKLWDDTVAGPRPDSGLGKLRKHPTFNFRPNAGKESVVGGPRSYGNGAGGAAAEDAVRVTRSIMIVRPPPVDVKDSPPASPAGSTPGSTTPGSTPPVSPFAGAGGREAYRFRRKSASFAYEKSSSVGPRNPPPPYDL
ncbi:dormancy-associated protein homolog 3 [Coffea eugenioides]|uniref:dormancy-associated protein homolog 3 n=1 Tax=Coffea eugenioides TaxID=49369 RepID=UPI000F61152F|nr:dormancy-associated protein homolog 3 [Coffea eugenioides]